VLEGNKVIEVRNTGVNKGTAAMKWLKNMPVEFILGIGDDWTDEDLFRALPPEAFSVRVGMAKTAANYHLNSHLNVRRVLRELSDIRSARAMETSPPQLEVEPAPTRSGVEVSLP